MKGNCFSAVLPEILRVKQAEMLCVIPSLFSVKEIREKRKGKLTTPTSEALNICLFYPDDHLCCHLPYLQKAGFHQELNIMILKLTTGVTELQFIFHLSVINHVPGISQIFLCFPVTAILSVEI